MAGTKKIGIIASTKVDIDTNW